MSEQPVGPSAKRPRTSESPVGPGGDENSSAGLLYANNLVYTFPTDYSVCVNSTRKEQLFATRTYNDGETMICVLNTGADYIDPMRSFLSFDIDMKLDGSFDDASKVSIDDFNQVNFGHGGSAINVIKEIHVAGRSNDDLYRIRDFNVLQHSAMKYNYPCAWWETVGENMCQSSFVTPSNIILQNCGKRTDLQVNNNDIDSIETAPDGLTKPKDEVKNMLALVNKLAPGKTLSWYSGRRRINIPLYCLGGVFATDKLLPSVLCSGMIIRIKLEQAKFATVWGKGQVMHPPSDAEVVSGYNSGLPPLITEEVSDVEQDNFVNLIQQTIDPLKRRKFVFIVDHNQTVAPGATPAEVLKLILYEYEDGKPTTANVLRLNDGIIPLLENKFNGRRVNFGAIGQGGNRYFNQLRCEIKTLDVGAGTSIPGSNVKSSEATGNHAYVSFIFRLTSNDNLITSFWPAAATVKRYFSFEMNVDRETKWPAANSVSGSSHITYDELNELFVLGEDDKLITDNITSGDQFVFGASDLFGISWAGGRFSSSVHPTNSKDGKFLPVNYLSLAKDPAKTVERIAHPYHTLEASYRVYNPRFIVHACQLTDAAQRALNEVSATNGLEIVYYDHETTNGPPEYSDDVHIEVKKAVSRALRAVAVIRDHELVNNNVTGKYACVTNSMCPESFRVNNYYWQLGSLYFPHQRVDSEGGAENAHLLETCRSAYIEALDCFGRYSATGNYAKVTPRMYAGQGTDGVVTRFSSGSFVSQNNDAVVFPYVAELQPNHDGAGILGVGLERSTLFQLSGVPINNSRVLMLHANFKNLNNDSKRTREIAIFLKYVKIARVFIHNIEVEE